MNFTDQGLLASPQLELPERNAPHGQEHAAASQGRPRLAQLEAYQQQAEALVIPPRTGGGEHGSSSLNAPSGVGFPTQTLPKRPCLSATCLYHVSCSCCKHRPKTFSQVPRPELSQEGGKLRLVPLRAGPGHELPSNEAQNAQVDTTRSLDSEEAKCSGGHHQELGQ